MTVSKQNKQSELNTANLRQMLMEAFDDTELTVFCFDYFQPVYMNFVSGMRRLLKTQLLIDYCYKHGKFDELLARVKETNKYQYDRFIASIYTSPNELHKQKSDVIKGIHQNVLEITVEGDFSALTSEQLEAAVGAFSGALASLLNVSQNEIRVLEVSTGSLVLRIQLPSRMAIQLETMSQANDKLLKELGILSIVPKLELSYSLRHLVESIKNRHPDMSDKDIIILCNTLFEEIGNHLNEGDEIAFVRKNQDKSFDLSIINIDEISSH